jgi:glycosyltransferase involved in cell wall biosynthesis
MPEDENPLVAILTPVYNMAAFLPGCIESVLAQKYERWEYIIVNNGSTDSSLEIAQRYAERDSRIRVHNNKEFVGVIENHNIAFRLVPEAAKYCKVISADDLLFPDCICEMVRVAEAHPSAGIVGSYQLSGDRIRWQGFEYPTEIFSGTETGRRVFLAEQSEYPGLGTPTSTMYRADLVRKRKAFYPNPSPHADSSACLRCLTESDYGFVFQVLSYERKHENTQSTRSAQINRYSSATLNDLKEYGPFFLTPDELRARTQMALKDYHRFLAVHFVTRAGDREFWEYHRSRLAELGHPLTLGTLLKAAALKALKEAANPGQAVAKLRKRLQRKKKSSASSVRRPIRPAESDGGAL